MGNRNSDLVIQKSPKSLFAESIRSIRTNLAFSSLEKEMKLLILLICVKKKFHILLYVKKDPRYVSHLFHLAGGVSFFHQIIILFQN